MFMAIDFGLCSLPMILFVCFILFVEGKNAAKRYNGRIDKIN